MIFEGGPVVDLFSLPAERGQPRLLEQVRNAIRRRHYSYRTEQAYVHWIKRYIYFHGKHHPAEMGANEVTAFLTHLARDRSVAASTQNQALSSLLFLCTARCWISSCPGWTASSAPSGRSAFPWC